MNNNIFSLIRERYSSFSKTFKLIADFIGDNYSTVSFLTIQELSNRIGVSTASIVRFCQELGYSGYQTMQREIQLLVHTESAPMQELRSSISDLEENSLERVFQWNIEALQSTYTETLVAEFKKSVELLDKARRIYVIGLRSSYTVAYYISFMLSQFKDNVILLSVGTNDLFDRLSDANTEDVLIAFSFSKYTQLAWQVKEYMKERGLPVIAVTDSWSAPIAVHADSKLIVKNSSKTYSFVAAMTVANALVVELGRKDPERSIVRLKEKEEINNRAGVYVKNKFLHEK